MARPQPQRAEHSFATPMGGFFKLEDYDDRSKPRKHLVAASGEFVGTFLFLFFGFLGHTMCVDQAADKAPSGGKSSQTIIFVSLAYSMSLLITAWTLYRVSGGLFNPAVTFGMIITGTIEVVRGLILIPVQFIAAMCAAGVASAIIPGDISVVQTVLAPEMSVAQGLFLEMFLTAQLVFTVLMLAAEKSKATFIAPIGIGLALFAVEIAGAYYTGGSLNPARSFGPSVAARQFETYHWIYWLGPLMGATLAGGFYHFVKFFNYEEANPGQDFGREEIERAAKKRDLESGRMGQQTSGGDARGDAYQGTKDALREAD